MLSELEALNILTCVPQLGSVRIRVLIQYFGSALAAIEVAPSAIAELPGFKHIADCWGFWRKNHTWKRNLELVERYGVKQISYTSPFYPARLKEIPDYPVILYLKGNWLAQDQHNIAIVGTRNASKYGLEMAERFAGNLANSGLTIISGLARGIDTVAHSAALRHGRTIAVIGSGLARIYPQENLALSEQIAQNGAIMSEFPMEQPPDKQNFPQRNRIVAGLCSSILMVEGSLKSGAMITMNKALSYHRRLFAIPGRIDEEGFEGNHHLIKKREAELVLNPQEILETMGTFLFQGPLKAQLPISLDIEEKAFYNLLPLQEFSIEELIKSTGLPVIRINILLMTLVLKKLIRECPGKIFKKVGAQRYE